MRSAVVSKRRNVLSSVYGLTTGPGANIFLAYYHYCNKSVYPFSNECKDSDLQNLAELDQTSINFVQYTRNYAEEHSESCSCKQVGGDIEC